MAISLDTSSMASVQTPVVNKKKKASGTKLKIHDGLSNVTDEFAGDEVEEPEPEKVEEQPAKTEVKTEVGTVEKLGEGTQIGDTDADGNKIEPARVNPEIVNKSVEPAQPAIDTNRTGVMTEVERDELEFQQKRRAAEFDHLKAIQDSQNEYMQASLARLEVETKLKEAKLIEKGALQFHQNLLKDGPKYPTRDKKQQKLPFDGKPKDESKQAKPESKAVVSESTPAKAESKEPVVQVTDGWESIPTGKILEGIKGMGDKKRDQIIHAFPTLGKLEAARAEASKDCRPFATSLPKGCGQGLADQIENKILEAVAKIGEQTK